MKIMSYNQWCRDQEQFHDTMPLWYWSPTKRMERYHAYEKSAKAWRDAGGSWPDETRGAARAGGSAVPAQDVQDQGQAHPAQGETQGDN